MNKKKDLLFVMNNLKMGGAEKALVSLLNELDDTKYNIDLLLLTKEGSFLSEIPENVNLLLPPSNFHFFDGPFVNVLKTCNPRLILNRFYFKILLNSGKNASESEQLAWSALRNTLLPLKKHYDVAVGYLEKTPNYYVVDKVKAKQKIGFIHNDYVSLGLNKKVDKKYFSILDNICTISQNCLEVLKLQFPEFSSKFHLVHNVVSKEMILKKASEGITEKFWSKNGSIVVSVGRLESQKGFHLSIETAAILKDNRVAFQWYIFGEGSLRKELENLIIEYDLTNHVYLVGIHSNPIKFMQNADVIVQTSLFEGKSIVIDEAKILTKSIIVTNYPTAKDQIQDQINGLIVNFDPAEIAAKIECILQDSELRLLLQSNLDSENSKSNLGVQEFLKLLS